MKLVERMDPICQLVDSLRGLFGYEGGIVFKPWPNGHIQIIQSFHITQCPVEESANELMSTGPAPQDQR